MQDPSKNQRARPWLLLPQLDRLRPFSALPIRVFLGFFLLYMSQDNVFSSARMHEFTLFLEAHGFPLPEVCARVSVYAQFACGALILLGAFTRWAALLMVGNFIVAIAMVHVGLPLRTYLEPSAMLAASGFLLMHGPGRPSFDAWCFSPNE